MELHNTGYGKKLFESDIPGIRTALESIAKSLESIVNISSNDSEKDDVKIILNTLKNCTAYDFHDVLKAIENETLK